MAIGATATQEHHILAAWDLIRTEASRTGPGSTSNRSA